MKKFFEKLGLFLGKKKAEGWAVKQIRAMAKLRGRLILM